MKETKKNRTFGLLVVVIVVLGVAVITQGIAMFGLHKKMDALGTPKAETVTRDDSISSPAPITIPSMTNSMFGAPDFGVGNVWDPFKEMQSMREQIDQMFGSAFNRFGSSDGFSSLLDNYTFSPDIDIEDKGEQYVVTVDLPGMDEANLEVKVDGRTLSIAGEVDTEVKEEGDDGTLLRQERRSGKFRRILPLPDDVDADKMTTEHKKGVLYIELPKAKKQDR